VQICDIRISSGCSFNGNPHMDLAGLSHVLRWYEKDFGVGD